MFRFLLLVFALTVVVWLLVALVPALYGWRGLANLGIDFSFYLVAVVVLLQGYRLFIRRRQR